MKTMVQPQMPQMAPEECLETRKTRSRTVLPNEFIQQKISKSRDKLHIIGIIQTLIHLEDGLIHIEEN